MKKKGGWEGKKNSIFVKREKDLVENFYWGFLNLKKKTKKDKKKKYFDRLCLPTGAKPGSRARGPGAAGPERHSPEEHPAVPTDPRHDWDTFRNQPHSDT